MSDPRPSFNLLEECWIPVRALDGHMCECSLRDTLDHCQELSGIADSIPIVHSALLRLLIALVHRAIEGPCTMDERKALLKSGRLPMERIGRYLKRWADMFDLFDPVRPFMQVPALQGLQCEFPVSKLCPEHTSGNNPVLFDHSFDDRPRFMAAPELARRLVSLQATALTSGKSALSHTKDSPSGRAALIFVQGLNLFETIVLNMVRYDRGSAKADSAVWEREPPSLDHLRETPERNPVGPADRYTWRSRAILLKVENRNGVLGASRMLFASGESLSPEAFAGDPMAAYKMVEEHGLVALTLRTERKFWRDYLALLPRSARESGYMPPRVVEEAAELVEDYQDLAVMVLAQAAVPGQPKIEIWRKEAFPLPKSFFQQGSEGLLLNLRSAIGKAEEVYQVLQKAGYALAAGLIARDGSRKPAPGDVRSLLGSLNIIPQYWTRLETEFPRLVRDIGSGREQASLALNSWLELLVRTARTALGSATRNVEPRAHALKAVSDAGKKLEDGLRSAIPDMQYGGGAHGKGKG